MSSHIALTPVGDGEAGVANCTAAFISELSGANPRPGPVVQFLEFSSS